MRKLILLTALMATQTSLAGGTDQKPILLNSLGQAYLMNASHIEGGTQTNTVYLELSNAVIAAKLVSVDGGVDTFTGSRIIEVTSAELVAESQNSSIIRVSNGGSDTLVEVKNSVLIKSEELLSKLQISL